MRNNFLSKAYGGVTVAQHKLNGLGLPRQWKVITSTLLLLFTFAIGNVWAATVKEVYFVKASENPGTQSTIFTGAPTDNGNLTATFTVDGTEYSCTRRTSNASHSISFSLAANKTARLCCT